VGEWFQNEDFWEELYPFLFTEQRLQAAETEVESVFSLTPYDGGPILDLCCGPGRHTVALARRGLQVTGVDRSAYLLDRARRNAREAEVEVEWVHQDMREFVRPEAFSLVLNMFSSFGYFDDPDDDRRVLANVQRSLRPGGALLIDLAPKECVAAAFEETSSHEIPDGSILFERRRIVDDWSRILNQWIVVRGERASRFDVEIWLYSARELKDRLRDAGFERIVAHGSLEGEPYGPGSRRLVLVAIKN